MSSYIQIPYGFRKVSNPIQFSVPKSFEENQYLNRIGYISNKDDPAVKNNILDAVKNRKDLQKWILATSDFGRELQQDINKITGGDEKFNNAVLRRTLDLKSDGLFQNPQPIILLFNDVEKFHQQNPIIGKLATQINVSKLSERDLVKRRLLEGEISKIEDRLHNLKYGKVNKGDDDNDDDNDELPTPPKGGSSAPPMREAEMDPSFRHPSEPKEPKKEPERDLQKVFRELRYGKVKPREAPPDPLSPTFWNEVFKDPNETVEDKIEQNIIEPREEFDFTKLPSVPTFEIESHEKTQDSFSRPITKMLDETIEITPKAKITEEKEISDTLQQLFPDVEKIAQENKKADVQPHLENLSETLAAIGNEVLPFEFEFFKGGTNEKFNNIIRTLDSGVDTLEFLNFLQSKVCKKILEDNKLKIHVETGNIYYDNNDTNESIHNFVIAQANPISGEIDHKFTFDRDYVTYFQWLTDAFSESKKNKLDIFTNKNSKFLFYHFNDYLEQNGDQMKKIKHSVVTQDYIAAEQIQDKNWKYFVESLLSFSQNATDKEYQKSFLLDTQENLVILKKTYEKLYNQISKQFNTTLNKMPFDLFKEIKDDFMRENYGVNDLTNPDNWVSFYFKHGRFPGNGDLTILPQTQLPKLIDQLSVEVSPVELYKKFGNGDAKSLVSFQAIIALFLYYGGEGVIAKRAMDEWKENLTFQALSKENDKITMKFDYLAEIVFYFLKAFLTLEAEFEEHEKIKLEISNKTIDASTVAQIFETSTPKKTPIRRPPLPPSFFDTSVSLSETDSAFLKTSFTMSKPNLDALIEAAEEENRKIIQNIVDPTPGFFVDEKFTDDDLNKRENENEAEFKLGNAAKKRFETILDDINKNINVKNESSIQFSNEIDENRNDFAVQKQKENIQVLKSVYQTKIETVKPKKNLKTSPYNLRSYKERKRKRGFLESADSLQKPYLYQSISDKETNKIKAAESVIDSIVKQLPDRSKKLKFSLDTSNAKITEL